MLKKIFYFSLLISSFSYAGNINIAVAANVSYAIDDLIKAYEKKHPATKVRVTLGSSGKLTAQIKNGAPYSLFMSANMKYPEALYKQGFAITKPIVYAKGALAYFSTKQRDFSSPLQLLQNDEIKRIAIGNPKTAPYGVATVDALKNMNIFSSIKHKFVYGESISQTISYTMTATDMGIVAKSSLYSPRMSAFKEGKNWIDVDKSKYNAISQGVVVLKGAENNLEVNSFYRFILGEEARVIFKRFGYEVTR